MVSYEVTIKIATKSFQEYLSWLTGHVQEMLEFPGFLKASILKEYGIDDPYFSHLTIQYTIDNETNLQNYLDKQATRMRDASLKQFSGKFTVTRKTFEILQ